ncbi:MAG: hypothetical protein ABIQ99_19480 [Thermoflexales bacterium]
MRYILPIVGALLALTGAVWMFQGIGLLLGSQMTSQPFWAVAGALTLALGVVLVVIGLRRLARPRS